MILDEDLKRLMLLECVIFFLLLVLNRSEIQSKHLFYVQRYHEANTLGLYMRCVDNSVNFEVLCNLRKKLKLCYI